jgi:lysozyme family protein
MTWISTHCSTHCSTQWSSARAGLSIIPPIAAARPVSASPRRWRARTAIAALRHFPRDEALAIYRRLYWLRPRFDQVARRAPRVAAELFDIGINMGPAVAATFLQRALTALNREGKDFADLVPDGRVGPRTLDALDGFLDARGVRGGETVLLRALEALQGERYLRLAERRPANESFLYGWLANRIGER